jgi:hypothetical protein
LLPRAPRTLSTRFGSNARRSFGSGICRAAGEVLSGQRSGVRDDLGRRALRDDPAAVHAGARPEIDDVIGRENRVAIVLDDEHVLPMSRSRISVASRRSWSR